jgi:uncharacterized membrane protein
MHNRAEPPLLPSFLLGVGLGGFVDYQLLGIHHVRDDIGGPIGGDLGFLAFGLALALVGWALVRSGRGDATPAWQPGSRRGAI